MLVTLKEIMQSASAGGYAVGLFNTLNSEMLNGVLNAAEEMQSPVIIGTAEVLLPYASLEELSEKMIAAAKKASVPVAIHFDHGLTFEAIMRAIRLGFTSVMYDGSLHSERENIENSKEVIRIAHAAGVSVECEIGHVGTADGTDASDPYTTVEEAARFYESTHTDALAIAVGTAHGAYKSAPKLAFDRLLDIHSNVDVPLVLHGGSGLTERDFQMSVQNGIRKINIFTDLCVAGQKAIQEGLEQGLSYPDCILLQQKYISEVAKAKMICFGSSQKA